MRILAFFPTRVQKNLLWVRSYGCLSWGSASHSLDASDKVYSSSLQTGHFPAGLEALAVSFTLAGLKSNLAPEPSP